MKDLEQLQLDFSEEEIAQIKERREAWVKTLRSDKYKQGVNCLRNLDNTYCCLGVACDLVGKPEKWKPSKESHAYVYEGNSAYLSDRIAALYGLSGDMQGHLGTLNDDGKSFQYIADYIEKRLL